MSVVINGSAGVTTNSGAVYDGIQSQTAKSATSTSVDFTGIPSWVKRVTVMLNGVSTSGTSALLVQLGDSGGIETTGYTTAVTNTGTGSSQNVSTTNPTDGFSLAANLAATDIRHGILTIVNVSGNTFTAVGQSGTSASGVTTWVSGSKTLSATLDRVRITATNGTDTFDAGTINILYE